MAEHNLTYDQQQDVESHAPYLTIFFILLNFTLMEYIYASFYHSGPMFLLLIGASLALTLLTWVAKVTLHIQYNRKWVYLTLIPAVALALLGQGFPLILGLLIMAVTKAALVGIYFMHLKYEGNWVYIIMGPTVFLATVLSLALVPDMAMQKGADHMIAAERAANNPPLVLPADLPTAPNPATPPS